MRRLALLGLVVGILLLSGHAAGSPASPTRARTVPCNESIDQTRFPYIGGSRPEHRYRLVLGAISVPPAFMEQIVPTNDRPWPYWRKAGLVVRADGRPVTVTVPPAWRDRVAIAWGNAGHGVFTSIRFAGCTAGPEVGQAFAGGFYLRSRSSCVPLVFAVGDRTTVFRFGLGRRCR